MLAQKRHGTSLGGEKAPQKRQKVSGGGEASASAASVRSRTSPSPVGSSVGPEAEPQAQVRDSKQVVNQDGAAPKTFRDLGIAEPLCEACDRLKYKQPTPIQAEAIPLALAGRDVIGLAETGSGKTAAFALPILQDLLSEPRPLSALVLAPTRELAFQIRDAFAALGSVIGVRCAVVVGGMDMVAQAVELSKSGNKAPHVVVATPGRLVDHLEKTKGFSLRKLRHLVIDEADRMLDLDFGDSVDKILKFIPRERRTALFSATMSAKVESLQRASLRNPVRVSVTTPGSGSAAHAVVATLQQNILIIPHMYKDVYTVYLLSTLQSARSFIIFTRTVHMCQQLAILLRKLGFSAIPLHGQMSQSARLAALGKFKTGARSILVATDVAARGIDVPSVDVVLNYDTPLESKTYVHRVGRTARAGRAGKALTLVSQFEHEPWLRIEAALGKKFSVYEPPRDEVMVFRERVDEAARLAKEEVKELEEKGKRKGGIGKGKKAKSRTKDDMDAEEG